jgi:hypothetical protein
VFNRNDSGFLDTVDIPVNLLRFNNDPYLTRYLAGCFNPEFHLRVEKPRDSVSLSLTGIGIRKKNKIFNHIERIF